MKTYYNHKIFKNRQLDRQEKYIEDLQILVGDTEIVLLNTGMVYM